MNTTAIIWMPAGEPDWPLQRVAGLSLVERNLMALRAAGVEQVRLCCHPDVRPGIEAHLARRSDDPRLPEVHLDEEDCNQSDPGSGQHAVVLDGRRVYHPSLLHEADRCDNEVAGRLGHGQPADTAPGRKQAERLLFGSLAKPVDGWFSKHLNRPVSTRISRVLARFPIHPNLVTIVGFLLVGIPAALFSALGSYLGFAIGGVLFQLFSILDGVDGELARVKFLQSRTGQWLDSIADNLSNILYLAGVTVGVHRALGYEPLVWIGIAAVGLHAIEVAISFWDLATSTRSATKLDFEWEFKRSGKKDKPLSRLLLALEPVARQDFYSLLFMVLALAGVAWLVLPLAATAFCAILLVKLTQLVRRRAQPLPN